MDRLMIVVFILVTVSVLASYCSRPNNEENYICQMYFGERLNARLYCDELSASSASIYLKVYNDKNAEIYRFEDPKYASIGIDSIKNDTIFLYRNIFSRLNNTPVTYEIIENTHMVVCCRDITVFGSARSEGERKRFLKRLVNLVLFEDSFFKVDSIKLNDLSFSGNEVSLIKHLDQNAGKLLLHEHVNFVNSDNKRLFFKSLNLEEKVPQLDEISGRR